MPDLKPSESFVSAFLEHERRRRERNFKAVETVFDRDALKRICEMHETEFAGLPGFVTTDLSDEVMTLPGEDFYYFQDNGASILAVAHLDTVGAHEERTAHFMQTAGGEVIYSRALDDRLGAYVILDMLPRLGIEVDVLLTVGEESGNSTAQFFDGPAGRDYDWIIEFDRGGTDVVMYDYEDDDLVERVRASGARVGMGSFSDICYLTHLGRKGLNWGVGYRDYHGPRAHAYLNDTFHMVARFIEFHEANAGVTLEHTPDVHDWRSWGGRLDDEPHTALWAEDFDPDFVGRRPEAFDQDGYYIGEPDDDEVRAVIAAL